MNIERREKEKKGKRKGGRKRRRKVGREAMQGNGRYHYMEIKCFI